MPLLQNIIRLNDVLSKYYTSVHKCVSTKGKMLLNRLLTQAFKIIRKLVTVERILRNHLQLYHTQYKRQLVRNSGNIDAGLEQ